MRCKGFSHFNRGSYRRVDTTLSPYHFKPREGLKKTSSDSKSVQGEGDYKSAKKYDESVQSFVKAGKVPEAATKSKPATPEEAQELLIAERVGLSHSKGEDAGVKRKARTKS